MSLPQAVYARCFFTASAMRSSPVISIALGIAAGVCCNQFTAIHPALCLVIGIATFLLLLWLQNTSIGFWLVGGLLTLIYAAVFGLLAYFISEHDPIWGWVIFALVFLVVGALHLRARDN